MTICEDCKKEYWTVDSCTFLYVSIGGKLHKRTAGYELAQGYAQDFSQKMPEKRCDDCGVFSDKVHHVGCTLEQCPVCKDFMVTCTCEDIKTSLG